MNFSAFEKELIARLATLPVSERFTALEIAQAQRPQLRERFAALLLAAEGLGEGQTVSELRGNVVDALTSALAAEVEDESGVKVGNYKLLQKIGEGGFGVVWMAEQLQPVRRHVALKIIKVGMDTEEVISRFEAERQALALMEHPNIARVFDGGATDSGRPYFVMELVRGIAITRYCDENRLSSEARLRLFTTVCHAVHHAHQKGVIHRDLKPSNILVTLHDGAPVPKIIDFGIAKATSARLTEKTLFTQFHTFMGTPAYTSPEQMEMSGLDIDTRSDIYSLGVLLYELLTGHPPFDSDALVKSGLEAMRRTIREIDPPRPSHRLGTLSAVNRVTVAHQRDTEPAKLSVLLRGDLDWIAMRCLEKDRARRYESAASLAADIERHLSDDIVDARPPSGLYQTGKFIRRHKLGVFAATAVAASLIAGLVTSSLLLVGERAASKRALAAEKIQGEMRQEADEARGDEVKRAARTALDLANRNLGDGRVSEGLAYLVYAARKDPLNFVLGPRIASVLAANNFLLPESPSFECGSRVVAIRYTLDGQTFVAGTQDGTLRVFEAASGKVLREFHLGKPVLLTDGWVFPRDSDATFAACFQDGSLGVFDAATGQPLGTAIQLDPAVFSNLDQNGHGISPDGHWICAIGRGTLWLWDALTGEKRLEFALERGAFSDFDFSADGRCMAAAGGDEVRLWSLPDCTSVFPPIAMKRSQTNYALHARFLSDNRRLAIVDPLEGVQLCDAATGAFIGTRIPIEGGVRRLMWELSPDRQLLSVGANIGKLLDLETGRVTPIPPTESGGYLEKHFNRTGSLLLMNSNDRGSARLIETATGKINAVFAFQSPISLRSALSPDGTQVVIAGEGSIQRLHVGRGAARPLVLPRTQPLTPLVFLPQPPARLMWFAADRTQVLDVASGQELPGGFLFPRKVFDDAPGEGSARSPLREDLRFSVVRNEPGWEAWEFSSSGKTNVVPLQDNPPSWGIVTFSAVGNLIAITSSGREIGVWDLRSGARAGPPIATGQTVFFRSVNFSPDGQRLGAAFQGGPAIWEIATGKPVAGSFTPIRNSPLVAAQFSPDGSRLLSADRNGEARLWDTHTGEPRSPVLYHADAMIGVQFSPDGKYFVTRSRSEARVWKTSTAAPVGQPLGIPLGRDFRFSPDGLRFVDNSNDGNVRVFDVRTAQAAIQPMDHSGTQLPSALFSPDGRFLRVETLAPNFQIWSLPPALPEGARCPEWLLELATACAGASVNDQGQLVASDGTAARIAAVRSELAALPTTTPLGEWGRWILDDRAERPIAPGFTLTPTEAARLHDRLVASANPSP